MKGLFLGVFCLPLLVSSNPFEPDVVFDLKFDASTLDTLNLPVPADLSPLAHMA